MQRSLRLGLCALALLLFPLTGCETKRVWIELSSFGANSIDGIWLWQLSSTTGRYERTCRIPFGDLTVRNGVELLPYLQECGDYAWTMEAEVERTATDTIRVSIWYQRFENPGTYKITSYGASGESALSATTLEL